MKQIHAIHSPVRGIYLGLDENCSAHFSRVKSPNEGLNFLDTDFALERLQWIKKNIDKTAILVPVVE